MHAIHIHPYTFFSIVYNVFVDFSTYTVCCKFAKKPVGFVSYFTQQYRTPVLPLARKCQGQCENEIVFVSGPWVSHRLNGILLWKWKANCAALFCRSDSPIWLSDNNQLLEVWKCPLNTCYLLLVQLVFHDHYMHIQRQAEIPVIMTIITSVSGADGSILMPYFSLLDPTCTAWRYMWCLWMVSLRNNEDGFWLQLPCNSFA